ncbi:peptidase family M48-domain-containing protein [Syncephalis pseudoplumigaleata]|uniref:CAAX prenyl protease n=1 Tax=Syncephalis pseudoplumigaleata TaxID=1712513 RepID=A0A4P9YW51_9FUNG|nr:peptidase family M48-domain-containing protein [Syncephalis pseudoplumigaleata]|eukprot:RKP24134.1 peptidase family M48-domain-containing protein [Syncephalis pseudoplumigaleata]
MADVKIPAANTFGTSTRGALPYKELVLAFSYGVYLLEQYIHIRQHRRLRSAVRPAALEDVVEQDAFLRAQAYGRDKSRFRFVQNIWSLLLTTAILSYDLLPLLWNAVGAGLYRYAGLSAEYEITRSVVFVLVFALVNAVIDIPFNLYGTFVIEERHGFNKQTLALFFTDFVKSLLVSAAIGAPLIAAFLSIIHWAGASFYYYVWLFMVVFQLVMITIYPTLIQPLFNKFTPLPEGQLRTKIEALAARIQFPLTKLYVIDGSRRSSHSNAYFFGFYKNKRIVLFDTLLEHSTEEEVCAVLGHELGHWKLNHMIKNLVVAQIHLFTVFYLFSHCYRDAHLYRAFGFTDNTMPVLIGFLLFNYIFSPVESVLSFAMNMLSRKYEFEADAFAKKLGYTEDLKSGLIKLHTKNLGDMNPDPWYSAYHFSHPPLVERLAALGKTE